MKLDISGNQVNDEHIDTLVKRCNKISELNLRCTSITNFSIDNIVMHLNLSLEKLNVGCTNIEDHTALLPLGYIKTLKILQCQDFKDSELDIKESEKIEILQKKLPTIRINKDNFSIASSNLHFFEYENGIWEIRAKQQQLFAD